MAIYYTKPQESLTVTSAHNSVQSILTANSLKQKKEAEFHCVDTALNSETCLQITPQCWN